MGAKYAFILGEEGSCSVRNTRRWAKASTSGCYHWKTWAPARTALWRAGLAELITHLFTDSDGTCGYRRIHAAPARAGRRVDPRAVRSIMAARGLVAAQPRAKGPRTTISSDATAIEDLQRRDLTATGPGRRFVGDITCIRTRAGRVYLATVLDCATASASAESSALIIDCSRLRTTSGPASDRAWPSRPAGPTM